MDKRLVFKLFSETLNWRATMDLMIGRSLQQTIGARGLPVMTYSINTDDDHFIVYLERSANKWPLLPENFSFFIMRDGKPQFYRLKRDLINLGRRLHALRSARTRRSARSTARSSPSAASGSARCARTTPTGAC